MVYWALTMLSRVPCALHVWNHLNSIVLLPSFPGAAITKHHDLRDSLIRNLWPHSSDEHLETRVLAAAQLRPPKATLLVSASLSPFPLLEEGPALMEDGLIFIELVTSEWPYLQLGSYSEALRGRASHKHFWGHHSTPTPMLGGSGLSWLGVWGTEGHSKEAVCLWWERQQSKLFTSVRVTHVLTLTLFLGGKH